MEGLARNPLLLTIFALSQIHGAVNSERTIYSSTIAKHFTRVSRGDEVRLCTACFLSGSIPQLRY